MYKSAWILFSGFRPMIFIKTKLPLKGKKGPGRNNHLKKFFFTNYNKVSYVVFVYKKGFKVTLVKGRSIALYIAFMKMNIWVFFKFM